MTQIEHNIYLILENKMDQNGSNLYKTCVEYTFTYSNKASGGNFKRYNGMGFINTKHIIMTTHSYFISL